MMTMNSDELNKIAKDCGIKHGYRSVAAEFMPFCELKCTWQRTSDWVDFRISDYLAEAPKEVVEQIVEGLFGKITGDADGFSDQAVEYLTSQGFRDTMRPKYMKRKSMTEPDTRLTDALNKACEILKVDPAAEDIRVGYSAYADKIASCSVLFRAVMVNPYFEDVLPSGRYDEFLVHAVARAVCHIIAGYGTGEEEFKFKYKWMAYRLLMEDSKLALSLDEILDSGSMDIRDIILN